MIDDTKSEPTGQTSSPETVRNSTDRTTAVAPTISERSTGLGGTDPSGRRIRLHFEP